MKRTIIVHIDGDGVAHRVPQARMQTVSVTQPPTVALTNPCRDSQSELKDTRRVVTSEMQPASRPNDPIFREAREASSLNTKWTPTDYHKYFCVHDRARWQTCNAATCRRDFAEAQANWDRLVGAELI